MRILNFGSWNFDYVYAVDHIVCPGETTSSLNLDIKLGGKGFNQSVALAKAGAAVYHAGKAGSDGRIFIDTCKEYKINSDYIKLDEGKTGHAIIQVDSNGQNSILLYSGANGKITMDYIDSVLAHFTAKDIVVLQNEISNLSYLIDKCSEKEMTIVLNPSPFNKAILECSLNKVDYFILNEIEGMQLTSEKDYDKISDSMHKRFPAAKIVLTLGAYGAMYRDKELNLYQKAFSVKAVDTTAAGDTFTGYFIAGIANNSPVQDALRISSKAASIAVTRWGASPSIPDIKEVISRP